MKNKIKDIPEGIGLEQVYQVIMLESHLGLSDGTSKQLNKALFMAILDEENAFAAAFEETSTNDEAPPVPQKCLIVLKAYVEAHGLYVYFNATTKAVAIRHRFVKFQGVPEEGVGCIRSFSMASETLAILDSRAIRTDRHSKNKDEPNKASSGCALNVILFILRYAGVVELDLRECALSSEHFKQLASISSLETLVINKISVFDGHPLHNEGANPFNELSKLTNLTVLDAGSIPLDQGMLDTIFSLIGLERLNIGNCDITPGCSLDGIKALIKLKALEAGFNAFSNDHLNSIFALENLESLDIKNCSIGLEHSLDGVQQLQKLTVLGIGSNRLSPDSLSLIFMLHSLQVLYMSDCGIQSGHSFEAIKQLQALLGLDISQNNLSDEQKGLISASLSKGTIIKY